MITLAHTHTVKMTERETGKDGEGESGRQMYLCVYNTMAIIMFPFCVSAYEWKYECFCALVHIVSISLFPLQIFNRTAIKSKIIYNLVKR